MMSLALFCLYLLHEEEYNLDSRPCYGYLLCFSAVSAGLIY